MLQRIAVLIAAARVLAKEQGVAKDALWGVSLVLVSVLQPLLFEPSAEFLGATNLLIIVLLAVGVIKIVSASVKLIRIGVRTVMGASRL